MSAGLCAAVLGLISPRTARADDANPETTRKLIDLDQRTHILALEFNEALVRSFDERVVEAQVLQSLGDHTGAVTILLDVLDKQPGTRVAEDAAFLLGESFFQLRDYRSSRRHFEGAIEIFVPTRRAQQALLRLIEIALRTEDFSQAETYFAKLDDVPAAVLEPALPYARAKYLYFRDRIGEAKLLFAAILPSSPYYFQARYFLATSAVKSGDLSQASTAYDAILGLRPSDATAREIQDLARLALGRIFHKRGQFERAAHFYGLVEGGSRHFPVALFELGWTHIERKDFFHAYHAFDALLRTAPDWPDAPELQILMGNLEVRLGHLQPAGALYAKTRDEFGPMYEQAQAAAGHDLGELEAGHLLAPKVTAWIRADPEMARTLTLARDVADTQQALEETARTLAHLDQVVARKDKVALFADLARTRDGSTELLRRLTDVRARFAGGATWAKGAQLVATASQWLEEPIDPDRDARARADAIASQLLALDQRVAEEAIKRLVILKQQIAAERARSEAVDRNLQALLGEQEILKDVYLAQAIARATTRLYELVVRSDAGLIDVLWGEKDERTRAITKLVADQQREMAAAQADLDQEF